MTSNTVTTWLQIFSNIGVVIGLFFVGFQIIQDRELKRAELTTVLFSENRETERAKMGDNPAPVIAKVLKNETLTEEDQVVADAYLWEIFLRWMYSAEMEQQGIYTGRWRENFRLGRLFQTDYGLRFAEQETENQDFPEWFRDILKLEIAKIRSEKAESSDR